MTYICCAVKYMHAATPRARGGGGDPARCSLKGKEATYVRRRRRRRLKNKMRLLKPKLGVCAMCDRERRLPLFFS